MNEIIVILTAVFIATNIYVEWVNRLMYPWNKNALSTYLYGVKDAQIQAAGYVVFAVNLLLVAAAFGGAWYYWILLAIGCVALLSVVATKILESLPWVTVQVHSKLERLHVISAGIAFATVTGALGIYSWSYHSQVAFALACLVPLSAALFWMFEPEDTVLEEKSATGFLLASLLAIFLPLIYG